MLSVQSAILGQVSREASRSTLINNLQGITRRTILKPETSKRLNHMHGTYFTRLKF